MTANGVKPNPNYINKLQNKHFFNSDWTNQTLKRSSHCSLKISDALLKPLWTNLSFFKGTTLQKPKELCRGLC